MYKFIAHRGNDDDKPENSKEAILNSINKSYIYGVEFDIRITKDNNFVIHHNATINSESKHSGFIRNMTIKELKKLNFNNHNQNYKIATLKEVLKKINNDKIIIIEIKEEKNYTRYQKSKLIHILNSFSNLNIYLASFNYKLISDLKNFYPNCGLIIGKLLNRNKNITDFPFLMMPLDFYKKYEGVQEVFIWTINSKKDLKEIKDNSYVISDKSYSLFTSSDNHQGL